jgi:hypothetical protein
MDGVKEFMTFVRGKFGDNVEILCPCSRCLNQKYLSQAVVNKHMMMNGMDSSYTKWIHHGEDFNVNITECVPVVHNDSDNVSTDGIGVTEDDNNDADHWEEILGDLQTGAEEEREAGENEDADTGTQDEEPFFKIAMREAKRMLYPG